MELKPGYKQTDEGVIPENWRVLPITKVARLESGHTPSKRNSNYWGGSINWISLFDIQGLSKNEISTTEKTITEEGLDNSSARLLPAGTVVFSRTATVGKTSVMASSMATSQDFANYICGPDLYNIFLVYLFRSMGRVWKTLMAGSIHNTIYMPTFKALEILVPPLPEQIAIAEALSDTDVLIESLEKLLIKKRQIKQGAMQALLTGQRRLPGFDVEWVVGCLGDVVDQLIAGVSVNSDESGSAVGVPGVLKTSALIGGDFISSECKAIVKSDWHRAQTNPKKNTILISRMNTPDLVGEVGYVGDDHPLIFLPDRIWMTIFHANAPINARWLCYLLSSSEYRCLIRESATGTSGSMKNISKSSLLSLPVRFPEIEEQSAIASTLSAMGDEITSLETQLQKARYIKQGMMQELLTGRIRLV